MTTYMLCKKLIERGRIAGLLEKLDVYLLANRLTIDEYKELVEEVKKKTDPEPSNEG